MYQVTRTYADGTSETVTLPWFRTCTMLRDQQTTPNPDVVKIRVQNIVTSFDCEVTP